MIEPDDVIALGDEGDRVTPVATGHVEDPRAASEPGQARRRERIEPRAVVRLEGRVGQDVVGSKNASQGSALTGLTRQTGLNPRSPSPGDKRSAEL